jgi:acyl carrier protein
MALLYAPGTDKAPRAAHMTIAAKIRGYIRESFLFGGDQKLSDEDSLLDAGVIDSTGAMELVSFLESEFRVDVSDQDLVPENLDSVAAMTAFVTRKLASQ